MNPVTTALQTIAAIQGETRERHVDAASRYSTEPVHSQSLSASSLSIGRDRRTAASAKGKSDCGLGQRVEVPPTAQATSAPEAALAREIRIDKRDRVIAAPAGDIARHAVIIMTSAFSFALVTDFGWIEGFNSDFFTIKPASLPVEKRAADLPDAAQSDRLAFKVHRRIAPLAVRMRSQNAAYKPQTHCGRNRVKGGRKRRRLSTRRFPPNPHLCQRPDRQPSRGGPSLKLKAGRPF